MEEQPGLERKFSRRDFLVGVAKVAAVATLPTCKYAGHAVMEEKEYGQAPEVQVKNGVEEQQIDPILLKRQQTAPHPNKIKPTEYQTWIPTLQDRMPCPCQCKMDSLTECHKTDMYKGNPCGGCVDGSAELYGRWWYGRNGKVIPNEQILREVKKIYAKELEGR